MGSKQSAVHNACSTGNISLVEEYLTKGGDPNARKGLARLMPLHVAAIYGQKDIVALLIEKGANIEGKQFEHSTALILAAQHGKKEIVSFLVEHGADIQASRHDSSTALHLASFNGHRDVVQYLIDNGADPICENEEGFFPGDVFSPRIKLTSPCKSEIREALKSARSVKGQGFIPDWD
mmetsp:Transcript_22250/g.29086  ORF Transcript_22250/g.29086 Transcript_22250/m.29086 type:complete len:179 (-) Transcript_22250:221-757(-)|eukprot:CAMPEP_0117736448 /NCGR_PEP_ID=MMETSP0947-20121206/1935_1 /TAXON_ID=44440 /ORGANISM="Chattonella subsalsa, Strain CCMP2191" /LENGTH=178 /DNA_ID=CAMNT_0005551739 /DNA_START=140 /DNA_END=676 /DNA_ORIENTATION=-